MDYKINQFVFVTMCRQQSIGRSPIGCSPRSGVLKGYIPVVGLGGEPD